MTSKLKSSTEEQGLLRAAALWAADYAEQALPLYESRHPTDPRPRAAIAAGRAFGQGKKRDKNLRISALAAFKAARGMDEPSNYAARAASLTAAVAYTHTDLQGGRQGIRQARHVLGPAVYAALALVAAAGGEPKFGDDIIRQASESAPSEVRDVLTHMPPQPNEEDRLGAPFHELDSALRAHAAS